MKKGSYAMGTIWGNPRYPAIYSISKSASDQFWVATFQRAGVTRDVKLFKTKFFAKQWVRRKNKKYVARWSR